MKKLIALAFVCTLLSACGNVTGDGEKVGTIIKLSKEGIVFKTWEAEIIRGGMSNGSGGFSAKPFYFTIDDETMLPKVQAAFDSQKEVKIHYKRRLYLWFTTSSECHGDECNYLTDIK